MRFSARSGAMKKATGVAAPSLLHTRMESYSVPLCLLSALIFFDEALWRQSNDDRVAGASW